jgi:hypothetical protein
LSFHPASLDLETARDDVSLIPHTLEPRSCAAPPAFDAPGTDHRKWRQ